MLDRRRFLTHTCSLGVAVPTLASGLLSLASMRQAAAADNEYRALVCILLAGGNDSFNMLVPTDTEQYSAYAAIRSDLALEQQSLLPVTLANPSERTFGLHPSMGALQTLLNNGDACMLANTGTLLEAFDAASVQAGTANLPVGLFSHADQIQQWQTAVSNNRTAEGWAGRIADRAASASAMNGLSMNISLSGSNIFQSGRNTNPYSISASGNGAVSINEYNTPDFFGTNRKTAIDALLAASTTDPIQAEYQRRFRNALDSQAVFADAMQQAPMLTTMISENNALSNALAQIARVISVRDQLGASRQTFFVTVGGWDHHDEVLDNQARMLPLVANAMADFRALLGELAVFDQVTTFTTSDFGRTLTSNGRGSDHGWGGHHVVMGGSVQGARLFGEYPLLATNAPLDVGRGIYAPTTSVDEYFAELALWFGVSASDLTTILPNIGRFYSPQPGTSPLGFLS
ncbi:MAG: DUF1501 domain-containing protein [Woeseiaceae bacterium]